MIIAPPQDEDIHPIITLQVSSRSGVSSVVFLPKSEIDLSDDSSDDEGLISRTRMLLTSRSTAQQALSRNYCIVSCHTSGEAHVWNLQSKRSVYSFSDQNRGSGLALRRVLGDKLAFQTRDGIVSVHDMHTKAKVLQLETESQSFCALAVDRESNHMVTLPSRELSVCNVRDLRQSPTSSPVAKLEASGGSGKDHGMLLSLALRDSIVACGLEDGNVFFHDLRKPSVACGIKLASSFILGLDLAPSAEGSIVAVAGVAGNAEDLRDLPESEQGTIALIKCMTEPSMRAQVRSRVGTCSLVGDGKPGVDVGMFRPDGRLFAIGGWDRRVRLFDRRTASLLAIMKGHHDSVRALDWATDSLLVSGDNRGTIHIWNVEIS